MEKNDDVKPTFFCVPDITGFTKFIATADINFSKDFIPSLLRRLINANILKMNVGEIEGDAIFFYKTGRLPSVNQVAKQCKLLFKTFYDFVRTIEKDDPENYHKHLSGGQMGLKIVIHFGHISTANIKGRTKLIGEDVIITHKLLKNSVEATEYVLLTQAYLDKIKKSDVSSWFHWDELKKGCDEYDHIGIIDYWYIPIEEEKV
ncbi:DUF2652 domain-containing protein [Pedobacter sp. SYSU D00535]|uniref:DUF2652 domain-containing protein n=1 Tax=Pedobacter sp. SYSU D00535 TaxID=2810308 RepID=UPI001A963021|nr:DUF2652 domain-containing protein [Pedobacter sp. SYSU D00535]